MNPFFFLKFFFLVFQYLVLFFAYFVSKKIVLNFLVDKKVSIRAFGNLNLKFGYIKLTDNLQICKILRKSNSLNYSKNGPKRNTKFLFGMSFFWRR